VGLSARNKARSGGGSATSEDEGRGKVLARCARRGEKKERGSVARWLAILTDMAVEKDKRGVWFGTCHTAGGAGKGRGGPTQRSGSVGWPAPARSQCARAGDGPQCTIEEVGWLPGGPGHSPGRRRLNSI
jgi:hypothetical protein